MHRERLHSIITQASELARLLMRSTQPPRKLTAEFLHGRKRASGSEKALISSLAHHAILHWRYAAFCVNSSSSEVRPKDDAAQSVIVIPAALLLALNRDAPDMVATAIIDAFLEAGSTREDLRRAAEQAMRDAGGPEAQTLLDRAMSLMSDAATSMHSAAILASLPGWVVAAWQSAILVEHTQDLISLGLSLSRPAPLTLRTNTLICSRDQLMQRLRADGHRCMEHPQLPDAVILAERVSLTDGALYEEGCFEVQDAGSQLISLACGVSRDMHVYDTCAGGGGKTMHLANIMQDSGSITGSDIARSKLRGMMQRGERLGLRSLSAVAITPSGTAVSDHDNLPAPRSQDVVLVDAPCSGFGTARRSPTIKWKLTERTVRRLATKQLEILERSARYVQEDGVLVYATCSLLPQENQEVVAAFMAVNPDFVPDPLAPVFHSQGVVLPDMTYERTQLVLYPGILDSDGYFMARMRRRG